MSSPYDTRPATVRRPLPAPDPLVTALAGMGRALVQASREVRLLGAVTPLDAARERERMVTAFEARGSTEPRWRYAHVDRAHVRRAVDAIARELEQLGAAPLVRVYQERAAELAVEAALVDAIGTPRFGALAAARFSSRDVAAREAAATLAREWLALPVEPEARTIRSDDPDAGSLVSRMRAEVGRLRLPFGVTTSASLAALAAIGDQRIWVAAGRDVTAGDVERTVVHELYGHALPRVRAATLSLGIFAAGTARGDDEQEGLAILLEERAGFLGPRRKRELAARRLVVEEMSLGKPFVDAVRALLQAELAPNDAVRIAERAYRGGDGHSAGLGRERVYIEAFARVRAHLALHPDDEAILTSGQVAVDAIGALRPYCPCE